jgi:hypothetical protein
MITPEQNWQDHLSINRTHLIEPRMSANTKRCFDFEIGYLTKSPCRDCFERINFPACSDTCTILEKIQTALAPSISTHRSAYNNASARILAQQTWRQR